MPAYRCPCIKRRYFAADLSIKRTYRIWCDGGWRPHRQQNRYLVDGIVLTYLLPERSARPMPVPARPGPARPGPFGPACSLYRSGVSNIIDDAVSWLFSSSSHSAERYTQQWFVWRRYRCTITRGPAIAVVRARSVLIAPLREINLPPISTFNTLSNGLSYMQIHVAVSEILRLEHIAA